MDGAREQHYRLALRDETFGFSFGGDARVGQTPLDFPVTIEITQGFRRGNRSGDERPSLDRLAQFLDADFVAGFFERLKVGDDFVPIEQLAIDADLVPEMAGGRGNGGL